MCWCLGRLSECRYASDIGGRKELSHRNGLGEHAEVSIRIRLAVHHSCEHLDDLIRSLPLQLGHLRRELVNRTQALVSLAPELRQLFVKPSRRKPPRR